MPTLFIFLLKDGSSFGLEGDIAWMDMKEQSSSFLGNGTFCGNVHKQKLYPIFLLGKGGNYLEESHLLPMSWHWCTEVLTPHLPNLTAYKVNFFPQKMPPKITMHPICEIRLSKG